MRSILKPGGKILIVEPLFHVSKTDFRRTISVAEAAGFKIVETKRYFLSRAATLT